MNLLRVRLNMASVSTEEDEMRHNARIEWNAAASGWKKYGKGFIWMKAGRQ
jgi:hypothetical protein